MYEILKSFIDRIAVKDIFVRPFTLFGFNRNIQQINWGYIPFYKPEDILVEDGMVNPDFKETRSGLTRSKIEWIVYHETGNTNIYAKAKGHSNYIQSGPKGVSWHFTVDDTQIFQHIPIYEVAWHAGDGTKPKGVWTKDEHILLGGGNMFGVGIETCVNEGVNYNKVMRKTAKLIGAKLLIDCNLTIDAVKQHYDFSGKNCPQGIRNANRFQEVLDLIQMEYYAEKHNFKELVFHWASLSPKYLDQEGYIIGEPKDQTKVSYMVTVKNKHVSYTFGPYITTIHIKEEGV